MQEIGQLVFLGHSLQIDLDAANAKIATLEEQIRQLGNEPKPPLG
jgi:hypothetical protein